MFQVHKSETRVAVETGAATFEWDLQRGGQLTQCELKGLSGPRPMIVNGGAAPDLRFEVDGEGVRLSDLPVEVSIEHEEPDRLVFRTRCRIRDTFTIEQDYQVFREGVVFCEFGLSLDDRATATVADAELGFELDVATVQRLRTNTISRTPYLKQDVTCVHVLPTIGVGRERGEKVEEDHLLALCGLDLGWDDSRYFSHRLEMILEDNTSIGGGMLGPTRTVADECDGAYTLVWQLCPSGPQQLEGPFLYRNKWALFCGCARTEGGAGADPVRRNNVLGARICHVMYPYVRDSKDWPWSSVPIRQTFYQDVQLAEENPGLERIDEAAELGANICIIHQFWMNNGGSNGEPMADYAVFDPDWLRAFIDRAHEKGMRVALYGRGVEQYSMYADFFEKYLRKDYDGLYLDWASPFAFGFSKSTTMHCSVYNWFMYMREVRRRVGENGILIGHTNMQTSASYVLFDAAISGEFSVLHSGLLSDPEYSQTYSGAACCGAHLIAGNSPDRSLFSSQRSAGFAAGLGYSVHPFMEPGKPFADCNAYIQPLWDLWRAMGQQPAKVYNPGVGTGPMLSWSHEALHPVAYQAEDGTTLLIVANLSEEAVSGSVTADLPALGLGRSAVLEPVPAAGTASGTVSGGTVSFEGLAPYFFAGFLVRP